MHWSQNNDVTDVFDVLQQNYHLERLHWQEQYWGATKFWYAMYRQISYVQYWMYTCDKDL